MIMILRRAAGVVRSLLLTAVAVGASCQSAPSGVDCTQWAACDLEPNPCAECLVVPGCGPICIPAAEACDASCPNPDECAILESFPAQMRCSGLVAGTGALQTSPGVPCGDQSCAMDTEFCTIVLPGVAPPEEDPTFGVQHGCEPLPDACSPDPSCECLERELGFVSGFCSEDPSGGLTFTIPLP